MAACGSGAAEMDEVQAVLWTLLGDLVTSASEDYREVVGSRKYPEPPPGPVRLSPVRLLKLRTEHLPC
eukprot:6445594-Amphidinium_carterae.1